MNFLTDKQTLNDLDLFANTKGVKTIFSLFNFTRSVGGQKRLELLFSYPLTNVGLINERVRNIRCCHNITDNLDIDKENLDFIEYYLSLQNAPLKYSFVSSLYKAFNYWLRPKNEIYIVRRGIWLLVAWLNEIYDYSSLNDQSDSDFIRACKLDFLNKIENSPLKAALKLKGRVKLFPYEIGKLDLYFRNLELINIRAMLETVYEIDAYRSIAFSAEKYGFSFPVITSNLNCLKIQGLFHPLIENYVSNDFEFSDSKNICFLTGPNMAGKSTFLKSVSISVYLSHLGFPVPAKYMETSIFNGLLTTINLSDNINKGYSHFYNEVLRVKYVAEQINEAGNIFVVFDELFRGTNVKDAYEASLSIIEAFSKLNRSLFAISTHIIEIADKLTENDSVFFKYFEANLVNEIPQFNYKIKDGVTNERLGMYILKKEKVLELIESVRNNHS
jgi:DNA mismatch repair ATPase MutS